MNKRLLISTCLITLVAHYQAHAALVTAKFQGYVSDISPGLTTTFNRTQPVSGELQYELTTPDLNGDPDTGNYNGALHVFEVAVGGLFNAHTIHGFVEVVNSAPDTFRADADMSGATYSPIAGYSLSGLKMSLIDPGEGAFSNDFLPINLELGGFDYAGFLAGRRWTITIHDSSTDVAIDNCGARTK